MIDFDALLERLENEGLGEVGVNLTFDTMPETVTKGICLRSRISGDIIDYEIPGLQRGEFRLICRAAKYSEGATLLNNAIKALEVLYRPVEMGFMRVRYCRAETTPMAFPVSEGNLREFAVNMRICYDYHPEEQKQDKWDQLVEIVREKTGLTGPLTAEQVLEEVRNM